MTVRVRRSDLPVLRPRRAAESTVALPADAPRIGLVTLGCDKNTVDSERLLARLAGAGAHVTVDAADADVVVINTCGFIDVAKEESVDAILDAVRLKQAGRVRAVVALGCMVQRYKPELVAEIPEVDLFLGLTEVERLVPELRARGLLSGSAVANMEQPLRLLSTKRHHTSHLKISEGCDHTCAFCAIPLMRGKHRSTSIEDLVREAKELEAAGVVELNLISQDTTWYGRDTIRATGNASQRHGLLPELLDALLEHTDIPWLRLFYMYPSGIYPALVERIAREPRIVPYIDMPIQHGADSVLKRMRRPERQASIRERTAWLRGAVPDLALRTTVIVGFPGETDEEFEEMLALLEEIRFDHLGAFAYSIEDGTPAAAMAGQVDDAVKRERLERLLDLQRAISQERNEPWVGREVEVLIDRLTGRDMDDPDAPLDARGATGRMTRQAVEIDGAVHIDDACGAAPGRFVTVRITDVIENDFTAVIPVSARD